MTDAAIGARSTGAPERWFYAWMAFACLAVAVLGFAPTYFLPLAFGQFSGPGILHLHGLLFFGWTIFFFLQSWRVASGRIAAHREWGMAGIALATAMVFTVFIAMTAMFNIRAAHGAEAAALGFTWVQASGMLFFGAVVAAAIANVQRSEIHKRLMLLATISLLGAPIARLVIVAGAIQNGAGPPPAGFVPEISDAVAASLIGDVLLLAAMAFDWRTRGRPHPVYLVGGAVLLLLQLTLAPVSESAAWRSAAAWIVGLAG